MELNFGCQFKACARVPFGFAVFRSLFVLLARIVGYLWDLFDICSIGIVSFAIYSSDISGSKLINSVSISFVEEFPLPSIVLIMIFVRNFGLLVEKDLPISIIVCSFWGVRYINIIY